MRSDSRWTVAALYQFAEIGDPSALRLALQEFCAALGVCGTLLVAGEGINGTLAGQSDAIATLIAALRDGRFGLCFDRMELKTSIAQDRPFRRLKIRLKREIVTIGVVLSPQHQVGLHITAHAWNAVITDPDTLVLDVRNGFEVALGTFSGAVDPGLTKFSDFRAYAATLTLHKDRRIAMFCTGGIRCEKASAYLLDQGFSEVLHLQGGILKYLEEVPQAESRWNGTCFVFDERVALGHGLVEAAGLRSGETQPPATSTCMPRVISTA